jgi:hypothetical protein
MRSDQIGSMAHRGFPTPLSICQLDPQERDEVVAQEAAHFEPIDGG